jgi:hypothetical protein
VATAPNLGTGGSVLDAQFGSSSGSNTNEPLALAHTDTNYLYLPGVSGNYASVPDSAALDITGDIDIRVRVALDDWTPSAINVLAGKWNVTGNQRSYLFSVETNGTLALRWSADGSAQLSMSSTVATGVADVAIKWARVTLDVDNGSGSRVGEFFLSDDGSTWTQLGTTVTTAGTTSIYSGTASVEIGSASAGGANNAAGKFYRAQILNGIGGTTVLDADFTTGITSGGQTSFAESSSNAATVTINRSTSGRKSVAVVRPVWLLGTDDFFEVADNDLLDFGATDSFTVVAVVRQWASLTSAQTLIAKATGVVAPAVGYAVARDSSGYYGVIGDGVAAPFDYPGVAANSNLNLIAAVRNVATDTITAYQSSSANAGATDTTTLTLANAQVMRIGRLSGASGNYADMELLAAMVFRRALSATELAAIATYYGI